MMMMKQLWAWVGGSPENNFLRAIRRMKMSTSVRLEGGDEEVAAEEVIRAVTEDDARSGHHAAQRAPDHPYLARQLSGGET
jgi:hypothetical protein